MTSNAEATLNALLDATVDAIVVIDGEGTIAVANSAACRLFGYEEAELIGANVNCLMPAPYREEHDGYLTHYRQTGHARIIGIGREVTGKRKDGTTFPIDLAVGESELAGERQFVGIMRDISERKHFEAQISASRNYLDALTNAAPIGISVQSVDGTLRMVNTAFCELAGRPREDIIGQRRADLVEAEGAPRVQSERVTVTDERFVHPDGTVRYVATHALLTVIDEEPVLISQSIDQTEQRTLEALLREQRRDLEHVSSIATMGEMLSGIAHELNQPLGAITTYTQASRRLLQTDEPDLERLDGVLDRVATQSLRAGEVIKRLREMLRKTDETHEVLDPNDVVEDVLTLAETDANHHAASIRLALMADVPAIHADKVRLQQVLLNLIRNALDAITETEPAQREVIVSTHVTPAGDSQDIVISVEDFAGGVDADAANRLFEPFFTTKDTGMGLGLSLSRSILQSFGGDLRFENTDQGARFQMKIPPAASRGPARDSDQS